MYSSALMLRLLAASNTGCLNHCCIRISHSLPRRYMYAGRCWQMLCKRYDGMHICLHTVLLQAWRQTLWSSISTQEMEEGAKQLQKEVKSLPKKVGC